MLLDAEAMLLEIEAMLLHAEGLPLQVLKYNFNLCMCIILSNFAYEKKI